MLRALWNGAISFGLVHVPVSLYPATSETGIDFDWLDKRSMDPVGYKRVNKRTGKEIERENIVKGVKQAGGEYVVLSDDEIKAAFPRTTQTIDIEAFVKAEEIDFVYLERPYYVEPAAKSTKVYTLLREAMQKAGVIGIARVVLHNKEHLAALIPTGQALMLNTLRWASEIRPPDALKFEPDGGPVELKAAEVKMARQLIDDMTRPFQPEHYADTFSDAILKLVDQRVQAGQTETVQALEADDAVAAKGTNVVDLSALLQQSLRQRKDPAKPAAPAKAAPKALRGPSRPAAAAKKKMIAKAKPSAKATKTTKATAKQRA
ncbi:MAG: Ku protein [Pseudomonadota bacterium]